MKKAVIFDLDGTLVDSLESIWYSANRAIEACGYPEIPLEKYKLFVGDGAEALIRRCLAYSGDVEEQNFEKVFLKYQVIFKEHCMYHVKPYEGIADMLDMFKQAGLKIAVFSNKPHERTLNVVERVFGKGYFDEILGQKDNRPKKPNPSGVYELAEKMGAELSDIVYVGDTCTDMMTGKNAGVYTVGVLWGFRDRAELEEYQADRIVEDAKELTKLVLE